MATLLRKVRLQLSHSFNEQCDPPSVLSKGNKKSPNNSTHSHNRCDLSKAVESEYSIRTREKHQQQQHDQKSLAELRRKLAKRASIFTLRNRHQSADLTKLQPPPTRTYVTSPLLEGTPASTAAQDVQALTTEATSSHSSTDNHPQTSPAQDPGTTSTASETIITPSPSPRVAVSSINKQNTAKEEVINQKQSLQEALLESLQTPQSATWAKMASESAAPPVPYERMKDIATEACDSALSSITSYTHASTESWNSTIINAILSALVKETSITSSQPNFKYVVNSTIIQHAATSSSEEGKGSGRRGMHSASGAYWNNEKDGMWSFKYEAAEAKGLDVVVGIIWVWVG